MTIEPKKPTISADTIYSLVIGNNANVTQTIVQQPRKANLFQLSADDPDFTGRSQYTSQITAILKSASPVAMISGMGGVGKSVLAKHVGNGLKTQYPDGQLFVDLRGQSELPREPIAVLTDFLVYGFGMEAQQLPSEMDALQGIYQHQLTDRKILVVLDNAKDGAQVEPLLPRAAGCGAIVTSREALSNLKGMTVQNFVQLDVMEEGEAITLLDRLCPEKTIDRVLTTELAVLCGRLPLALTIVGRLLFGTASLTLVKLVAELKEERSRLRVLKYRNNQDVVDPMLDVEASFNLSYGRLLPEQQQVFGAVAVLRGKDFGVELAAVLGEMEKPQVQRRLDQLVSLQLVLWEAGRYGFHDLVRLFGRETLAVGRERELAGLALRWYEDNADTCDHYLKPTSRRAIAESLVSEWEVPLETIENSMDTMAVEWFLAEHGNLVDAVDWAQALNEHQIAVNLAANFVMFFQRRSLWSDWVTTHQVALKSARAIDSIDAINVTLNNLGIVYHSQGKWNEALDCYQQSLETKRRLEDDYGIATTMGNLGVVYKDQGKWNEAIDCFQRSLDFFRTIENDHDIAQALNNLGVVYQLQGKWNEAINCFQQSLEIKRRLGDDHGIAQTMNNLGLVYQDQGKWDEAIDCFQQSLEIKRRFGDDHGITQSMIGLGNIYQLQGKWEEAIDCYQQSLEIKQRLGDEHGITQTMMSLGMVCHSQGKWEEAIDYYQQSLEISHAIGDQHGIAQTMNNLGLVYKDQGKWDAAIDCYQQDLEISRAIGDTHGIAQTINNLGTVHYLQGKFDNAIDYFQQSLETKRSIGDEYGITQTIGNLGVVYKAQERWEEAIDCFQQSIDGAHQIGDPQTEANGWSNLGNAQAHLGNPAARTSYQNAKALFQQLKLTDKVEACDTAISHIGQSIRPDTLPRAPKIGDDITPRKKKQQFPLWQSAIVLLLLGIGWQAIVRPPAPLTNPVPQNQRK